MEKWHLLGEGDLRLRRGGVGVLRRLARGEGVRRLRGGDGDLRRGELRFLTGDLYLKRKVNIHQDLLLNRLD